MKIDEIIENFAVLDWTSTPWRFSNVWASKSMSRQQRWNGFHSMVARIRAEAHVALEAARALS